jgi:DNA-binding response OmpR family regulator
MADVAPAQIPATILVIDDDMSVQMLASQALRNEGYHVLVASDMDEALRVSGEYAPDIDLVLTDIVLPSGNGMTLARALQTTRPNTPVLYMSGFGAEAIQAIQYEGGPNGGFLEKPFLPRVLIERVRQLLPTGNHDPEGHNKPLKAALAPQEVPVPAPNSDAVYRLETPVRCPQCGDTISSLKAVRLLRTQVNFTSTLPRRGRTLICPLCLSIVPAELTNF